MENKPKKVSFNVYACHASRDVRVEDRKRAFFEELNKLDPTETPADEWIQTKTHLGAWVSDKYAHYSYKSKVIG